MLADDTAEHLSKPENNATLARILTFHVIPGKVMSHEVVDQKLSPLLVAGKALHVDGTNGVMVNGASIVTADIECTSGMTDVIDNVLITFPGRAGEAARKRCNVQVSLFLAALRGWPRAARAAALWLAMPSVRQLRALRYFKLINHRVTPSMYWRGPRRRKRHRPNRAFEFRSGRSTVKQDFGPAR